MTQETTDLENVYPQTCLKKKGGCDGFKETSRNLEFYFIKVSKNEKRTYLTNFITVSISNGHKTKLNSNFVLALLTYQSYVTSKFSDQQKPDSNIHQPPTNELDCTQAIFDSHEMLTKKDNHLRGSELSSIHMPII